jgi:hypothetical protein
MQMNLLATGLLLPGKVDALLKLKREQLRQSVKEGFRESGPKMREIMHRQVSGAMKIRRQSFLKTYRVRHFDQKTDRLPAMLVGSTQKLAAVHESGGVIRPRGKLLLIPIGGLRVGQKTFKRNVEQLLRSGNAFFKKMPNGNLVLFAENIAENASALRRFKRSEKQLTGKKSIKRGAEIPIAVAVKSVTLRKRTRVKETILNNLSVVYRAVDGAMVANMSGSGQSGLRGLV